MYVNGRPDHLILWGALSRYTHCNTHCNTHYSPHCNTHCNTNCNTHTPRWGPSSRHVRIYICTYVRLVRSMKLCTLQQTLKIAKTHIHCSTNCIAHCNTNCNTHCNTNCNTHCNTNCNTHWNARKPFSDAPSKYLSTYVYQLRRSIKTLTLQHTLQRTLQHTLQHTLQCT